MNSFVMKCVSIVASNGIFPILLKGISYVVTRDHLYFKELLCYQKYLLYFPYILEKYILSMLYCYQGQSLYCYQEKEFSRKFL